MTVEISLGVEKELRDLAVAQNRDIGELVQEAIQRYLEAAARSDLEPGDIAETQLKLLGELRLEELLAQVSPENRHSEADFGAVGREEW